MKELDSFCEVSVKYSAKVKPSDSLQGYKNGRRLLDKMQWSNDTNDKGLLPIGFFYKIIKLK